MLKFDEPTASSSRNFRAKSEQVVMFCDFNEENKFADEEKWAVSKGKSVSSVISLVQKLFSLLFPALRKSSSANEEIKDSFSFALEWRWKKIIQKTNETREGWGVHGWWYKSYWRAAKKKWWECKSTQLTREMRQKMEFSRFVLMKINNNSNDTCIHIFRQCESFPTETLIFHRISFIWTTHTSPRFQ